jgi:hypothetical protein
VARELGRRRLARAVELAAEFGSEAGKTNRR